VSSNPLSDPNDKNNPTQPKEQEEALPEKQDAGPDMTDAQPVNINDEDDDSAMQETPPDAEPR